MSETKPFFDVPTTTQETSEGPVDLPILYYDTTYAFAFFWVDAEAAAANLPDAELRTAMNYKGKTLVALANYQYRNSTVGDYGEVGLAIPAVPVNSKPGERWLQGLRSVDSTSRDLAFRVLHMPVTTAAANAAGRDIWGLPKFVTPIKVDLRGRMIDISVADPDGGEPIMTLFGRAGLGIPTPQIPVVLYSPHEGQMLRVTVNGRGPSTTYTGGKVRLRVGNTNHPMAESLRNLGMDGLTPFAIQTTHASQSRLNKGVPIGR